MSALQALMSRRVATSDDREVWLEKRLGGVTATEIAKIAAGDGMAVLRDKLAPKSIRATPAMEWGNIREPHIVAAVQSEWPHIDGNSWLVHALGNERHIATPDGIGESFLGAMELLECKASKFDLAPAPGAGVVPLDVVRTMMQRPRPPKFWSTGYYDQMQWQLHVTGAERVVFAWERHDGDYSRWPDEGPTVETVRTRIFLRDEERIAFLVEQADVFLDALDRARAEQPAAEEQAEPSELEVWVAQYAEALATEAEGARRKELAKSELLRIGTEKGEEFSERTPAGLVTYKPGGTSTVSAPDEAAAKEAAPALWQLYEAARTGWAAHAATFTTTRETTKAATLRVTPAKTKEQAA
ncbi:YqaJ viral recombinase family protein [Rathayibacter sp. Leaf248]|uniref:YqaJ viral recombinase family protein n=1 Tax=Rathayibacter sp. Leaf248 TaxID=2876555 RepID=UPI001E545384|nr:YqaJ viral recombinase family protein [Rathayibacter sp. Leaf248]